MYFSKTILIYFESALNIYETKKKNEGFIDFEDIDVAKDPRFQKYMNMANYTDPVTKSSLTVNIKDFISSLKNAWEKLTHLRKSYNVLEPHKPLEI
jgi:hypothetical protein